MAWKKVPEENAEALFAALPDEADVEPRKMFGCPCAFVHGQMFCGTHEETIVVRLDEAGRAALLAEPGATPFEPGGRPMREYVSVPPERVRDVPFLKIWVGRALAYARTLPPKTGGGRRKKSSH